MDEMLVFLQIFKEIKPHMILVKSEFLFAESCSAWPRGYCKPSNRKGRGVKRRNKEEMARGEDMKADQRMAGGERTRKKKKRRGERLKIKENKQGIN